MATTQVLNAREIALDFADGVDLSKVDRNDRTHVKEAIMSALTFDNPMPRLRVDVHVAGDHYNVAFKGYNKEIDLERWYRRFCGPGRSAALEYVQSTSVVPETGVLLVRVQRCDFAATPAPHAPRRSRKRE